MKRIKALGLCLVAAFALAAVAASIASASATPEYYTKASVGTVAPSVPFTATSATAFLEGKTSGVKIQCKSSTSTGEVNGAKTSVKNVSLFKECEIAGLALPCENVGPKEIETKSLAGELGAITTALPGTRLKPESGEFLADFNCAGGGVLIKVKGSLIGSLSGAAGETPAEGKFASTGKLTFKTTKGAQQYTKFLGEAEGHQLESVVSEFNTEKKEFVTHEELSGQSVIATIKSVPASNLGETK
jgi:hypothetical protein